MLNGVRWVILAAFFLGVLHGQSAIKRCDFVGTETNKSAESRRDCQKDGLPHNAGLFLKSAILKEVRCIGLTGLSQLLDKLSDPPIANGRCPQEEGNGLGVVFRHDKRRDDGRVQEQACGQF